MCAFALDVFDACVCVCVFHFAVAELKRYATRNMPGCYACTKTYLEEKEVHWLVLSEKEYLELQQQKRSKGTVIHQNEYQENEFYLPMCFHCLISRMNQIRCTLCHRVQNAPELMQDVVNRAVLDYVCDSICDGRLQGGYTTD